jgi:hypothetical protein
MAWINRERFAGHKCVLDLGTVPAKGFYMRFTIIVNMNIPGTHSPQAAMLPNLRQLTAANGLGVLIAVLDFFATYLAQQTKALGTTAPVTV